MAPAEFSNLYPAASRVPFAYASELLRLDGKRVPGLLGSDLTMISNPDLLKRNSAHMGNCTFSYLNRCITGAVVIVRFSYQGTDYNASFERTPSGVFAQREVKARFNATAPPEIHEACERLATLITRHATQ